MIKLKKLFLKKLDKIFLNNSNRFSKYSTCFYKITDYINMGSQGKILKGYNRITRNTIALKIIEEEDKTYIKNEFKFFNYKINHKNIVKYKNVFYRNKDCYIIQEYLPQDLYFYLDRKKHVEEDKVRLITEQLLDGLDFLSSKHNLYHSDIKLENIALEEEDNLSGLKLIDFSNYVIIPKKEEYVKIPKYEHGTLDYLAPEVFIGKFYKNSDMWSVGILLYVLLTNKFIQDKYCIIKLTQDEIDKKLEELKKLPTPISEDLIRLIYNMLRIDPKERITIKEAIIENRLYNFKYQIN